MSVMGGLVVDLPTVVGAGAIVVGVDELDRTTGIDPCQIHVRQTLTQHQRSDTQYANDLGLPSAGVRYSGDNPTPNPNPDPNLLTLS